MPRFYLILAALLGLAAGAGCEMPRLGRRSNLPDSHEIRTSQLVIRSDVKISENDPLLSELQELREEIIETLSLPAATRPVVVHLFADQERYSKYMTTAFPNLPPRRAFFIGSPTELAVFAHWGDNVEEDLRHEYTHGILHASLRSVPLWLDEGLAEYFETPKSGPNRRHPDHTQRLAQAIRNGWKPDLDRLERLEDVSQMQRADYQESWAWVHYLLHEAPDGRGVLTDYVASLRKSDKPPSLAADIRQFCPDAEVRLASYVAGTLQVAGD